MRIGDYGFKSEGALEGFFAMSNIEKSIFISSNFKSPMRGSGRKRALVCGVGLNDANYTTAPSINGFCVVCPAYVCWRGIIKRSYDKRYIERYPTYSGVTVCDEWRSFMQFRAWWIENQVDNYELDKDLLSGDKVYSPSTCVFVPQWLNSFTLGRDSMRGEFPIGVHRHDNGRFRARCNNVITGKVEHLGLYDDRYDACEAWRSRKLELAMELKPKMDDIDGRIYRRVVEIIKSAK